MKVLTVEYRDFKDQLKILERIKKAGIDHHIGVNYPIAHGRFFNVYIDKLSGECEVYWDETTYDPYLTVNEFLEKPINYLNIWR